VETQTRDSERIVGITEVIQIGIRGSVPRSRLAGSDLRARHQSWTDYGRRGINRIPSGITELLGRSQQDQRRRSSTRAISCHCCFVPNSINTNAFPST